MTVGQCLEQVRQILTARAINAGGPLGTDSDGWFAGLPDHAQAELYETSDEPLTWTYVRPGSAAQADRMMIALLRDAPVPAGLAAAGPGRPLRAQAAQLLRACGESGSRHRDRKYWSRRRDHAHVQTCTRSRAAADAGGGRHDVPC
jgi:hypothetical protein